LSNIILCGFKACGKSTLGKIISEKTGMHFIDTDDLVSKNCRQLYFHSAEAFCEIEKDVIAALIDFQNSVIATGGGSVLAPENVIVLKKLGKIFYLRVPKEVIKQRLLSGELPAFLDPNRPEESFEEMYASRKDLYEQIADHIIDHEDQIWSLIIC
jgi:shikimate kinase